MFPRKRETDKRGAFLRRTRERTQSARELERFGKPLDDPTGSPNLSSIVIDDALPSVLDPAIARRFKSTNGGSKS